MSFPSSPVNNQTAVVNGITYIYNSTNNTWKRVPTTITAGSGNQDIANAAFLQANIATAYAQSAGTYANAAFEKANNASLEALAAFAQANLAFDTANVGYNFVNTGGTINGSVVISNNLSVTGNITLGGNTTSISSNNLTLIDPLIYLADGNSGNTIDIGIVGNFYENVYQHTVFFRDHLDGVWKFMSNVRPEPTTTVNLDANATFDGVKAGSFESTNDANVATVLKVGTATGTPLGGAINPVIASLGSSTGYIQNYIYNTANGSSSSADIAAYPNNGSDTSGWIDMGITSRNYSDAGFSVTGPNEGYIIMSAPAGSGTSGNLVFATDSTGNFNAIEFYTYGFNQGKASPSFKIDSSIIKFGVTTQYSDGTTQSTAAAPQSYSTSGYSQANTATLYATSAGNYANGAFTKANNALANTTGIFNGDLSLTGKLTSLSSIADEGGEINLAKPQTNTTLAADVAIDIYQNKLRFFENGGSARGFYIDITTGGAGASSDLTAGGGGGGGGLANSGSLITVNGDSQLLIANTVQSISKTTGALVVNGGVGISGDLYANNLVANTMTISGIFTESVGSPTISTNTLTLDLSSASAFNVSLNAAITTINITNPPPAGKVATWALILNGTGTGYSVIWPASVKWPNGTPPTITTTNGKQDMFTFLTIDGGTSHLAIISGQNF